MQTTHLLLRSFWLSPLKKASRVVPRLCRPVRDACYAFHLIIVSHVWLYLDENKQNQPENTEKSSGIDSHFYWLSSLQRQKQLKSVTNLNPNSSRTWQTGCCLIGARNMLFLMICRWILKTSPHTQKIFKKSWKRYVWTDFFINYPVPSNRRAASSPVMTSPVTLGNGVVM